MTLDEAVEILSTTYQPLDLIARGLVVDPTEVSEALADAEEDTVEKFVLTILAKYNPQETTNGNNTEQQRPAEFSNQSVE